jgi:peptide/nickel transport system permease protein
MLAFIIRRTTVAVLVLLAVSLLVFIGCELLPGDVAQVALGNFATEENVKALRIEFGLDRPAYLRYLDWLAGILQGDWGRSILSRTPVSVLLSERLQNTALLAGAATLIAVPLAVVLGLLMALGSGGRFDRTVSIIVLALSATPEFLIATIGVLLFAVQLHWLPAVAYIDPGTTWLQTTRALALPVTTLVLVITAQMARLTRAIIANVLSQPFIEMAMLKGVRPARLVGVHALINAVGPIANVVALNVAYLVSGVVVVETIFAYPGLARMMIDAVQARDMPVVQACALIFCATYVVLILLADILARVSDPHARSRAQMTMIH